MCHPHVNRDFAQRIHRLIVVEKRATVPWVIGEFNERGLHLTEQTFYQYMSGARSMPAGKIKALVEIMAKEGHLSPAEYFVPEGYFLIAKPSSASPSPSDLLEAAAVTMEAMSQVTHHATASLSHHSPGGRTITRDEAEKIQKSAETLQQEAAALLEIVWAAAGGKE